MRLTSSTSTSANAHALCPCTRQKVIAIARTIRFKIFMSEYEALFETTHAPIRSTMRRARSNVIHVARRSRGYVRTYCASERVNALQHALTECACVYAYIRVMMMIMMIMMMFLYSPWRHDTFPSILLTIGRCTNRLSSSLVDQ